MKSDASQRLFWFVKEGTPLALNDPSTYNDPSTRQMVVQQVLSDGRTAEVKVLLHTLPPSQFHETFQEIKPFLPREVKNFWEDFFGSH